MREKVNKFVLIEYLLCAIIILSTLLLRSSITSMAFSISFIVLLFQFIGMINGGTEKRYIQPTMAIIIVSAVSVLISTVIFGGSISFEYIKEYLIFCSTIILAFAFMCLPVNNTTAVFILKINVVISLLYPIAYRFFPQEKSVTLPTLYLNFDNPNLTGMWILQSVLYLILAFLLLKSKIWKLISLLSLVPNCFFLYRTGARNTWLTLFLFICLLIWIFVRSKNGVGKIVIAIANYLPIIFVPLYLWLINPIIESGKLDFLISEGKSLTSRVEIWNHFIERVSGHWITGAYPIAKGNLHNAYLVVFCSYGVVTLALVIWFFTRISVDIDSKYLSWENLFCLSAFLASLFMGMGEGCLFSGGQGIYILCCGFIYLARNTWEVKNGLHE